MTERGTAGATSSGWSVLRAAVRPYRRSMALGVGAGIVWTVAKVAVPSATREAVDRGILRAEPGALGTWAAVIVALGAVTALCTGMRRYLAFGVAWRVEASLRMRLFAHLQRLHFAFHDASQTGQLMARANSDLQQVQQFVVMVPITAGNFLTIIAVTGVLLSLHLQLAVLALCCLPLVNVAARRFATRLQPQMLGLQQELADLSEVVEETVSGIRVVKGFGAEARQARRLRERAAAVYRRSLGSARIRSTFMPAIDLVPAIGLTLVLWYGGHQVLEDRLSIGELIAFFSYVFMLVIPLRMTGWLVSLGQRAVVAAARVQEVLATEVDIVDPPTPRPLPGGGGGEVRFEGVRFCYLPGHAVLDGFDLTIAAGEAVALVGPTGSGKTTIARLLPRFYDVEAGRVLLDGVDVRDLGLAELRRNVGIVFEDTFLFTDTVHANISFADPRASQAAVEGAARLAGADEFITGLADGYGTLIGERGYSLSGGQRQRIAIARAILADPRVLILDDATSSVDPTKEHEIRDALAEAMAGRTTIVIAHRPATIALADRVVLLDEGRVVAEGTHDELLDTSERYREVLARQTAVELAE